MLETASRRMDIVVEGRRPSEGDHDAMEEMKNAAEDGG